MFERLRRLRRTPALRRLVREASVAPSDLILPLFVSESAIEPEPIESLPGQFRYPLSGVANVACRSAEAGLGGLLLFGVPKTKDDLASAATRPDGVVSMAVRAAKEVHTEFVVMTDVCVCGYVPHGHCGVLRGSEIDNDATLPLLAQMAVAHARAGADVVAPSSMMDGQVGAIREALDAGGYSHTAIMGYSAKFASGFYGPFRHAVDSAPAFGDRAGYQHDAANLRHARRELQADVVEGADILMVKPALAYLDVIRMAREEFDHPVAAYSVSGEYAMVKAAAERGWLDERQIVMETLTAFRRAGADFIISYHAMEAAGWLNDN